MEAGLGIPDNDAWNVIETIGEKNNLGFKQLVSPYLCLLTLITVFMSASTDTAHLLLDQT